MTTDFRALCARMADELDYYRQLLADDRREVHALAAEARAALAESIDCVACEDRPAPGNNPCSLCGRTAQPQPPADGEVGELVEWLRNVVTAYKSCHRQDNIWSLLGNGVNVRLTVTLLTRAADLLEQLANYPESPDSSSQPIPLSERKPGPEDCDSEGRCWCWDPATDEGIDDGVPSWEFCHWEQEHTHWLPASTQALPAHALPVPEDQP